MKSTVLIIEDETDLAQLIADYAKASGFDASICNNGKQALDLLRIKNFSIIILDLIDMESQEHKDAVLAELNKALSRDRTKLSVSTFSALGLVEVTRKRTRESLAHVLCEPCPACSGKGQVKTARTICYEILRELLREAKQFNPREFRIMASQVVVDMFLEEESQHLAMLGDFIGKPISLQVENVFHQEQYDIILM